MGSFPGIKFYSLSKEVRMNREQLFLKYLSPELGPLVNSAYLESKRWMGFTEERINFSLFDEDVSYLQDKKQSEILVGAIQWGATEQGHNFWKAIYEKLVEKEKSEL